MNHLEETTTLTDKLKQLAYEASELKLQLGRHTATRDKAVQDFEVLSNVSEGYQLRAAIKLRTLIEDETESITLLRRLLAEKEVVEGRLRKAAQGLLGEMLKESIFTSNSIAWPSGGLLRSLAAGGLVGGPISAI